MSDRPIGCTCLRHGIWSPLRSEVWEAERDLVSWLRRAGGLGRYARTVRRVKATWGLCPACDEDLRSYVLKEASNANV